jgi:hypothetical protein
MLQPTCHDALNGDSHTLCAPTRLAFVSQTPLPHCDCPTQALGLAVNRGPLAMNDWGFGQLALLYSIPIYPTESQSAGKSGRLGDSAGGGRQLLVRFLAQTGENLGCSRGSILQGSRNRQCTDRPEDVPPRPAPPYRPACPSFNRPSSISHAPVLAAPKPALLVAVAVLLVEFQLPALARYYGGRALLRYLRLRPARSGAVLPIPHWCPPACVATSCRPQAPPVLA